MVCSCKGLIGFVFGHNYEAQYDTEETDGKNEVPKIQHASFDFISGNDLVRMIDAQKLKKETYRCSVCTRCGHVVSDTIGLSDNKYTWTEQIYSEKPK